MEKNTEIVTVAFDFFDTVVHRKCHPETVLMSWARNICVRQNFDIKPSVLYTFRKMAEKEIKVEEGIEEPAYWQLMEKVIFYLKEKKCSVNLNEQEFCKVAYEIEKEIEINSLLINNEIIERLKVEKEKGHEIVLISDFYMPRIFFEEVLERYNIRCLFDELYISSEHKLRKSTGNLYRFVLKERNLEPEQLLMIGDNKHSDFEIPISLGISVEWKPYLNNAVFYKRKIEKEITKLLKCKNKEDSFRGYVPSLVLFMERLYKAALKNGCRRLLFCSREGQNLKELFDLYQAIMYTECQINTDYIFVSRRATLLPSLKDINEEKFERIFRQYSKLQMEDFLYSIGFENREIEKISLIENIPLEHMIINGMQDEVLLSLLKSKEFLTLYNQKREEQNRYIKEYIKKSNENSLESLHIVDIGWKGTIQDNIFECLGKETKIYGYYYGLYKCQSCAMNVKRGLMFHEEECTERFYIYSYNSIELEKVFSANHGQVLNYTKINNIVQPVLSNDEKDIEIYTYICDMQNNMNKVFEKVVKIFAASFIMPEEAKDYLAKKYLYYLCVIHPKQKDIYLNMRKKTNENFGNVSGKKIGKDNSYIRERKMKKCYLYVDYVYRIIDKCHMNYLEPLAWMYCHLVYFIKKIGF